MEVFFYALCAVLLPLLTLAVQLLDRAYMTPARRARVFLPATWGASLLYLALPSIIAWVWVTRQEWPTWRKRGLFVAVLRSALVIGAGTLAAAVVFVCFDLIASGCASILGVSLEK